MGKIEFSSKMQKQNLTLFLVKHAVSLEGLNISFWNVYHIKVKACQKKIAFEMV